MPKFVSVLGKWEPQKEKVYLPDQEKIYEGPDRAALEALEENGGQMGVDFRTSPEFVMRVRQMGFNSTEEYLKFYAFDEKDQVAKQKALAGTIHKHELPKRKQGARIDRSGGDDTSGRGNHMKGGFSESPDRPH